MEFDSENRFSTIMPFNVGDETITIEWVTSSSKIPSFIYSTMLKKHCKRWEL